ncbi:hypothetical protein [Pseudanabaena sp. FACHB-2040]|uniref:hypothetical protein n=1 Tax=Pseudanabaena sp. FACHB-2040 TaxID=2692859 RepID=UPI00168658AC|nr:hypothetical protein [Pseudanabaena sp. FACHB-2040]MBD2261409.1 hypothetical protein [Pseudanabaena sp. FACHB-2040]
MATRPRQQFAPGQLVRVAHPLPANRDLKNEVLEIVEMVGKSAVVSKDSKRRVVGTEQLETVERPIPAEPTVESSRPEPEAPERKFQLGDQLKQDLNTEGTGSLPSLISYGVLVDYCPMPNAGPKLLPFLRWENGTQGWASEDQLEPADRPVVVPKFCAGDRVQTDYSKHDQASPPPGLNGVADRQRGYVEAVRPRHGYFGYWVRFDGFDRAVEVPLQFLASEQSDSDATESEIAAVEAEIVEAEPAARLAQLEEEIQASLTQIDEGRSRLWSAVAAVKNEELWREAGHPNFISYCKERWGWEKSNAYDNAIAGEVYQSLVLSGAAENELPQSLGAMRELAKVPESERMEVLQQAQVATGGRVTGKAVRNAARPKVDPDQPADEEKAELEEPTYHDADGRPLCLNDAVVSAKGYALLGKVIAFDHNHYLPVVILQPDGTESNVKPETLLVAELNELPASPAELPQPAAPEAKNAHSDAETPSPVVEASGGGWQIGDIVVDEYRPYSPMVITKMSETQACCWDMLNETWIGWKSLQPYTEKTSISLESICKWRLQKLVKVLGKDAVTAMLEEV